MAGTLNFARGISFFSNASTGATASPYRRSTPRAVAMAGAATAEARRSMYEALGVAETATTTEIKAAYRAMAKRFHPDAGGRGVEGFLEIRRAYETLADAEARARYDRSIGLGFGFGFAGGEAARFRTRRWETDQCW